MKNREAGKAALTKVLAMTEDNIIPDVPTFIPDESPAQLLEVVEQAYMSSKIGDLLEMARKQRKIGKRQLARALQTSHGRITALENAVNLELKSITSVAGELGFDVQVNLIPRDGGTSLGAMLHGGK